MEKRTLNNSFADDLIPFEQSTRSKRRQSSIEQESNSNTRNRKRSAEDDLISYSPSSFLRQYEQSTTKRIRYEHSHPIESENQPPRCSIKHRSLILHTPLSSSTWDQFRTNSQSTTLIHSTDIYHRTNSAPNRTEHLTTDFSRFLSEHHHLHQMNPLRTTNLIFDSKHSTSSASSSAAAAAATTTLCTGNVSPAHSDSSSESTSTCSSDDQLHHQHLHFHQTQPWRTYRERENYEQLLDLAEKLADPNRFNQVNIDKFFSYRYQISILNSKQTACVICMSHFKNNQHIRVLPCQHEYHSKCIARWFTMNSSCPICRRDNFF